MRKRKKSQKKSVYIFAQGDLFERTIHGDQLDRLVGWAVEREKIRTRREAGEDPPWTEDEVLSKYRFTNVRRMDDRVSRWLLDEWYVSHRGHRNMAAACAVGRFVNQPSSLELLTEMVFCDGEPDWEGMKDALRSRKNDGEKLFNAAYIGAGLHGKDRVESIMDCYARNSAAAGVDAESLRSTYDRLNEQFGVGPFMAGQITADLRWAVAGEWLDKDEWGPRGPGSIRGLNRLYGLRLGAGMSQQTFDQYFADYLREARKIFPKSLDARLEAIDYENCLCEFDKYMRAINGEGSPKQLYRGGQ